MTPDEIRANADRIFVRETIAGETVTVALSELPEDRVQWWIDKWVKEGRAK